MERLTPDPEVFTCPFDCPGDRPFICPLIGAIDSGDMGGATRPFIRIRRAHMSGSLSLVADASAASNLRYRILQICPAGRGKVDTDSFACCIGQESRSEEGESDAGVIWAGETAAAAAATSQVPIVLFSESEMD